MAKKRPCTPTTLWVRRLLGWLWKNKINSLDKKKIIQRPELAWSLSLNFLLVDGSRFSHYEENREPTWELTARTDLKTTTRSAPIKNSIWAGWKIRTINQPFKSLRARIKRAITTKFLYLCVDEQRVGHRINFLRHHNVESTEAMSLTLLENHSSRTETLTIVLLGETCLLPFIPPVLGLY
jgi:hypothetical protein